MAYRPHCLAKNERNRKLIADYLGGMSRREVAEKYGIHIYRVAKIFRQQGVVLDADERARRKGRTPGRPPVWPDCPPHLAADYAMFRFSKRIPAAQARAMLDPGFQA